MVAPTWDAVATFVTDLMASQAIAITVVALIGVAGTAVVRMFKAGK